MIEGARNLKGDFIPDRPWSQQIYHKHVVEARAFARKFGSFELIVVEGGQGSGQVLDLWYDLGLVRPRRAPKGFRGLGAFAFKRQLPSEAKFIGISIHTNLISARTREEALISDGWSMLGATWDGGWLEQSKDMASAY